MSCQNETLRESLPSGWLTYTKPVKINKRKKAWTYMWGCDKKCNLWTNWKNLTSGSEQHFRPPQQLLKAQVCSRAAQWPTDEDQCRPFNNEDVNIEIFLGGTASLEPRVILLVEWNLVWWIQIKKKQKKQHPELIVNWNWRHYFDW